MNDVTLRGDDFCISYNSDTRRDMFGDADGGEETALIFEKWPHGKDGHTWDGDAFYILKGDWTKQYAKIIKDGGGRWDLKEFYRKRCKRYGSRWSTDFNEWGTDGVHPKAFRIRKSKATKS